jgi:transcriptional regulator with XRE-family HTH domain
MQSIGGRLKEERERVGMSQKDVMEAANVSRKTLFNYESNERSPDANFLAAMHQRGLDVQYIVSGERKRDTGIQTEEIRRAAETAFQMVIGGGITVSSQQFSQMIITLLNAPQSQTAIAAQLGHSTSIQGSAGSGAQVATGNGIVQVGRKTRAKASKKTP